MFRFVFLILAVFALAACQSLMPSRPIPQAETRRALERITESSALSAAVERACRETVAAHLEDLGSTERIWAALIDTSKPSQPVMGHFRGNELVYPASVVKVAYMVHLYQLADDGQVVLDERVLKACRDMVVPSSNTATQTIVDVISGVTDGPRTDDEQAWEAWVHRRESTNRYLHSLGLTRLIARQKTWDNLPDPNSLERQFLGEEHPMGYVNGNRMSAVDTAKLMYLIDQDEVVSRKACEEMRGLLFREHGSGQRVLGDALPHDTTVWSKGGWTDRWFHDASTVALADGRRYSLAVFTEMPEREGLDRKAVLRGFMQRLMTEIQGN